MEEVGDSYEEYFDGGGGGGGTEKTCFKESIQVVLPGLDH